MTEPILLTEIDVRGVARVTLNRPEVHNAFNDALIAELKAAFDKLAADAAVRVVVLAGNGKSFSAGADLNWMKRMAGYSEEENFADAMQVAEMFHTVNSLPQPTVARVHGSAFAGGLGLVSVCDIAVAALEAKFAVTEVRIGLIPATISPYLMEAIGPRAARRWFLTAERFDATEAKRIGLVHEAVAVEELDATVERIVDSILLNGPDALKACKALMRRVAGDVTPDLRRDTAGRIANIRASLEGREGISAFLDKRKPDWQQQ